MGQCCGCIMVNQGNVGLVQRLGAYTTTLYPGFSMINPLTSNVTHVNVKDRSIQVKCETKTKNNVFATFFVSIQIGFNPTKIHCYYYNIDDLDRFIKTVVEDSVRTAASKHELDETFDHKEEMTKVVKERLVEMVTQYEVIIKSVLIEDIEPAKEVKIVMNNVDAAKRRLLAAESDAKAVSLKMLATAEAEKKMVILAAEARKEEMKLHGEGIGESRAAIAEAMRVSFKTLADQFDNIDHNEVLDLLMKTQYIDMLEKVAANSNSNVVFMNHNLSEIDSISNMVKHSQIEVGQINSLLPGIKNTSGVKVTPSQENL